MELNVNNMPINTLYRFDTNKYVWSVILNESRNGDYKADKPSKFIEVYEITMEGYLKLVSSGELVPHEEIPDYNRGFGIRNYANGKIENFRVPMYLQELSINDLYELREAVAINYKKNNK